jgi:hypothetical protein
MKEISDDAEKLYALRVDTLYSHSVIPVAVTLCGASLLTVIFWNNKNIPGLLAWFTLLLLITGVRYYFVNRYHNTSRKPGEYRYWLNIYFAGAILAGMVWGTSPYIIVNDKNIADIVLLNMFILVLISGSIGIYCIFQRIYFGFNIPAIVPLIFYLLTHNDTLLQQLCIITIVFAVFIFIIELQAYKIINQLLIIKLDNSLLIESYDKDQLKINTLQSLNELRANQLKKALAELNFLKKKN